MSRYGDDHNGYVKNQLISEILDFLDDHDASELMQIVADALEEVGK